MRLKLILGLSAAVALHSSVLAADNQLQSTDKMPTVRSDDRTIEVRGLTRSDIPFGNVSDGTYGEWFLRSFVDRHTHVVVQHQLYVAVVYTDFFFAIFDTAHTDDGQELSIRSIDQRTVGCQNYCRHSETLIVQIPEELLRDRVETGFHVKISARLGYKLDMSVSPEMIQKQLTVLAGAEKMPDQAP